jgi:putative ABC transport system permease protein
LLKDFPNVTVLDTEALVAQLRGIVSQVALAVQLVFVFTVLAGLLVACVCGMVGAQVRQREAAICRALGASRRHMISAALLEFAVVGAVAGLLAALCSSAMVWGLASTVLQLDYAFSGVFLFWGTVVGALLSVVAGVWLVLRVSMAPVMVTLRA